MTPKLEQGRNSNDNFILGSVALTSLLTVFGISKLGRDSDTEHQPLQPAPYSKVETEPNPVALATLEDVVVRTELCNHSSNHIQPEPFPNPPTVTNSQDQFESLSNFEFTPRVSGKKTVEP